MGMYLAAVILLPLLGGVWLDSKWHTAPTFVLIGLFVGLAAGAAGTWLKVRDLSK
jgi:F0F1-type ATP synthase assembly protein I